MKKKLLSVLKENARVSDAQIAVMLGVTEMEVTQMIKHLEKDGIICGYKAQINWEKAEDDYVTALIELKVTPRLDSGFDEIARSVMAFDEVESVYLMSGGYDLAVMVNGRTFQEIAMFVAKRLSTLSSVISTATHFVLSRYKESGIILQSTPRDERRHNLV